MHGRQQPDGMALLRDSDRYRRALRAVAGISRRDGELPLA
jgi:hypothetical protein